MADCPDHDLLTALVVRFEEYRGSMDGRLEKLNELREAVEKDRMLYLRSDVFREQHVSLQKAAEKNAADIYKLQRWQAWVIGTFAAAVATAMLVGAMLERLVMSRG